MSARSDRESCPHRPPCPGCPRFGVLGISDEALTALGELGRRDGITDVPVHELPAEGYRGRARLAVRGSSLRPVLGIFELGTHRVVDIPRCMVQHPLVNRVADALRRSIGATSTSVYSDTTHRGLVRYLQVVVERASNTAQVVVVCNADRVEPVAKLFEHLAGELGPALHSLYFNGQSERANHILGKQTCHVTGPEATCEVLGGARVFFPPDAFGQANLGGFERILARIRQHLDPDERTVELYAGVGAIGLGLLRRGNHVVMNEVAPGSLRGLALGVDALDDSARQRGRVVPGAAEDVLDDLPFDGAHVIVDPPRKGLHARVVQRLVDAKVTAVTYLSCGLPALLRDVDRLRDGGFECRSIDAYALFPFTEHVETLVTLRRR